MTGYYIPVAMHGEINLAGFGAVAYDLEAGDHKPKDDKQAAVLAALHQNGLIELASAKPKAKAAKSEPTSDDKE